MNILEHIVIIISYVCICMVLDSPRFSALRQDYTQTSLDSTVVLWTPQLMCPGDSVTYTVTVINEHGVEVHSSPSSTERSSRPITGLLPNHMYNVTITAENSCGMITQKFTAVDINVIGRSMNILLL